MIDLFCSEYGWTVEQIFDHTKDQIVLLSKAISKRKEEDIKFNATIHGAELKKSSSNKNLDLEKDIDKLGSLGINVAKG